MIPTREEGPILSSLADAFEHQIKLNLMREPDYDPALFLYRSMIRNPSPRFFEKLKDLSVGRVYRRSNGETYPMEALLDQVASGIRTVHSQKRRDEKRNGNQEEFHRPDSSHRAWLENQNSRILKKAGNVQHRIQELHNELEHPGRFLDHFTTFIAGATLGRETPPGMLLQYFDLIQEGNEQLLRSGYPAWGTVSSDELHEKVEEILSRFKTYQEQLVPTTPDEVENVEEVVTGLKRDLAQLEQFVFPTLPYPEQVYMEELTEAFRARLREWIRSFERLQQVWTELSEDGLSREKLRKLVEVTANEWASPVRETFFRMQWHRLQDIASEPGETTMEKGKNRSDDPFHGYADSWKNREVLLNWGVEVVQEEVPGEQEKQALSDEFRATWKTLTEEGMEHGEERRVQRMLTADRYRFLRRHPESHELLEKAKDWCFDRYMIAVAHQVRGDWRDIEGSSAPSKPEHLVTFLSYFSPVWIALLVGAFFMLDFGNAWTEMARSGDWGGITITFVIGVLATYGYLFNDLRTKVKPSPGDSAVRFWAYRSLRVAGFLVVCLMYTVVVVVLFWYLLSGTEEVVHGPNAMGHIIVWSGFALFVGVFFGLLAQS